MPVSIEHRQRVLAYQQQQLKAETMAKKAPNPVDVYVGQRIRQARMSAGLSQEKLSDGLGLTFQQLQKYEKGVNRIAPSRLSIVAAKVGKPVAWFFPPSDVAIMVTADPAMELTSTSDGLALAVAFNRISDDAMRRAILATAQAAAVGE